MGFVALAFSRISAVFRRSFVGDAAMRKATRESDLLGWYHAAQADRQDSAARKKYSPPQVRKLTSEQAKLVLIGRAMAGDQGAKELMGLLFPGPGKPSRTAHGKDA